MIYVINSLYEIAIYYPHNDGIVLQFYSNKKTSSSRGAIATKQSVTMDCYPNLLYKFQIGFQILNN